MSEERRRSSDYEMASLVEGMKYMGAKLVDVEKVAELNARTSERQLEIINRKLDSLNEESLPRRVAALENMRDWVIRIVVGMVLTALVGLVVFGQGARAWS